jgi:2-hydroxychromene-2-carboxylate isomerase
MTWFRRVPTNWLTVMRAAIVAKQRGRVVEFSMAAFRAQHAEGGELWEDEEVARLAPLLGMDGAELLEAARAPHVKEELRLFTDRAYRLGAPGVPTVVVAGEVFWGDDRLEQAAAAARRR